MVRLLAFSLILTLSPVALGEILFEGYSKILSGDNHIGYVINRYEFDSKKKNFVSTYFVKTSIAGLEITESLKAFANNQLEPVSYQYTSMVNKEIKTIDATFKGGKMTATLLENGKKKTIKNDVPKNTFLSTFLVYWILKSDKGLKANETLSYTAVAEEDGQLAKGDVSIGKLETRMGVPAFKALNQFKDLKFESYIDEQGEVLSTVSSANNISTQLVATPSDATGKIGVSRDILTKLFGGVPEGKENSIAKKSLSLNTDSAAPGKQNEVPQGQGIQIKKQGGGK